MGLIPTLTNQEALGTSMYHQSSKSTTIPMPHIRLSSPRNRANSAELMPTPITSHMVTPTLLLNRCTTASIPTGTVHHILQRLFRSTFLRLSLRRVSSVLILLTSFSSMPVNVMVCTSTHHTRKAAVHSGQGRRYTRGLTYSLVLYNI